MSETTATGQRMATGGGTTVLAVIGALSFCHMLNDMMQSLLPAIYPMLKTSLNLDFGQIGLVTLSADARGHFYVNGTVNGRSLRFLVDTGATLTTLSRTDARRVGLDYRSGTPAKVTTGGGEVSGWRVTLDSVRVGATTVRDVEAFVVDNDALPVGLLGMSFLGRFDMHRQGETLALRHR